jgi:hypothetical protein
LTAKGHYSVSLHDLRTLHAPMKALFASKARSMLRKCAPQMTKDPASTTCRGWQMMKTGSSGV